MGTKFINGLSSSERITLAPNEVHIWYVKLEQITDPDLIQAYQGLMSGEEQLKHKLFLFENGRHQYLVTRALVRTVLSFYSSIRPSDWKFSENLYHRPQISNPNLDRPLFFNLSHSNEVIVCAVALNQEVGVDIEGIRRDLDVMEIAQSTFSSSEVATLRDLPVEEQRKRFFELWTLKEAYIKARGMGLSLPLKDFSFHLNENKDVHISFDSRMNDSPTTWQFRLFKVKENHQTALAIRSEKNSVEILSREFIPLRG